MGNHYYKYDWVEPPPQGGSSNTTTTTTSSGGGGGGMGKTRALKLYNTISRNGNALLQELEHGTKERREMYDLVVDSLNNISALHLREKEYKKAKDAATQAIQLDPYNIKALCRAAKATLMVGEYDECKEVLKSAEEIVEHEVVDCSKNGFSSIDIQRLKRELKQKRREQKKLEKEIYSQMLSSGGKKIMEKSNNNNASELNQDVNNDGINNNIAGTTKEMKRNLSSMKENESKITSKMTMYLLVPILAILFWALNQKIFY